ncbi:SGNH/GDSL hydrolase family protein [Algibacter sp. R77976]|uniref:SGNH/GDSL hydrolase family protein n=1 Tax=Algibacter sp. R77976 TaxID=3093873 RepID=UPI0037C53C94
MVTHFLKYIISVTLFTSLVFFAGAQNRNATHNILFIGNSLTSTNDLPSMVKKRASYSGYNIETKMIAFSNHSLYNHWKKGDVQKLIKSKKYDIVIIQQGPSSTTRSKSVLIEYGKRYSKICKENNVLLAYFMVWPKLDYYDTFESVIKNHEKAAQLNNVILLPVGKVWKKYFDTTHKFDYYGSDNYNPSKKGSEAAAKVITKIIIQHL